MPSYCDFAPGHAVHGPYHDQEYGFPQRDEAVLFERLLLEINQAGLSWETILKKREGFRQAYGGFDVDTVAAYGEPDRSRLLGDPSIIRNRLKVDAQSTTPRSSSVYAVPTAASRNGWTPITRSTSQSGSSCSKRPSVSPAAKSPGNS